MFHLVLNSLIFTPCEWICIAAFLNILPFADTDVQFEGFGIRKGSELALVSKSTQPPQLKGGRSSIAIFPFGLNLFIGFSMADT